MMTILQEALPDTRTQLPSDCQSGYNLTFCRWLGVRCVKIRFTNFDGEESPGSRERNGG